MSAGSRIQIAGQEVVLAIAIIDGVDGTVAFYRVVTQELGGGAVTVGEIEHLGDAGRLMRVNRQIPADGFPTEARRRGVAAALELAGYGFTMIEED